MGRLVPGHGQDVRFAALPSPCASPLSAEGVLSFASERTPAERLRSLLDQHFDFVWRSLRRLGLHEADVDDAAQEVFLVLAQKLDRVEVERERSFLIGTALRVASTYRRSSRRRREEAAEALDQELDLNLNPEELSELKRARPLLQEILDGMSLEQRTVFILSEIEELAAPAVAELLAVPVGTVHSRLRSARERFEAGTRRLLARESFSGGKR